MPTGKERDVLAAGLEKKRKGGVYFGRGKSGLSLERTLTLRRGRKDGRQQVDDEGSGRQARVDRSREQAGSRVMGTAY